MKKRLDRIGLSPFCLDLHDKGSKPEQIRSQLRAAHRLHRRRPRERVGRAQLRVTPPTSPCSPTTARHPRTRTQPASRRGAPRQEMLEMGEGDIVPDPSRVPGPPAVELGGRSRRTAGASQRDRARPIVAGQTAWSLGRSPRLRAHRPGRAAQLSSSVCRRPGRRSSARAGCAQTVSSPRSTIRPTSEQLAAAIDAVVGDLRALGRRARERSAHRSGNGSVGRPMSRLRSFSC